MQSLRRGITIIEVLASILIAAIGVTGVMVLIPFAVSQAQHGVNQVMANQLAVNAAAEFELRRYGDPAKWLVSNGFPASQPATKEKLELETFVIDPIGISGRNALAVVNPANNNSGFFPYVSPALELIILSSNPSSDANILTSRATPLEQSGFLNRSLSQVGFVWQDDLVFETFTTAEISGSLLYPTPDVAPPKQTLDVTSQGPVRRQFVGKMSCFVVSTPEMSTLTPVSPSTTDDSVTTYRNYFVVCGNRPIPAAIDTNPNQPYDRVYLVNHPYTPFVASNEYFRYLTAGGSIVLTQPGPLQASNSLSTQRAEIRTGDWIALVNVTYDLSRSRFVKRIQFYQVLDATSNDATAEIFVTLQGPDFFLGRVNPSPAPANEDYLTYGDYAALLVPGPPQLTRPSKTYAIHLPDVWAVVERSYQK